MKFNSIKEYMKNNSKNVSKFLLILGIILVSAFVGIQQNASNEIDLSESSTSNTNEELEQSTAKSYYVDISGAVNNPGVYKVNKDTRLVNLIDKAGGLKENADIDAINQAAYVEDGSKIIIPELGSTESETTEATSSSSSNGKVNINQASLDELTSLPGIGAVIAQHIIDYRSISRFDSIEDIKNVKGIGDATYEKLKDQITV